MGASNTERGTSWREQRRLQAWDLKTKGWPQKQIAEAMGVTEGAVSQWLKRGRERGVEGLRQGKWGGSQPKLSPMQRARLLQLLSCGAEAFGFEGDVWTLPRVSEVIRRELGVRHHPAHVSRILRACRWSNQKPIRRARERDEEAIAMWKNEYWPELKKKRKGGA